MTRKLMHNIEKETQHQQMVIIEEQTKHVQVPHSSILNP